MTPHRVLLFLALSTPLLAQSAATQAQTAAGQQSLLDATYLAQVANYLAGNLTSLDVSAQSYTIDGFGPVIDSTGTWRGAPLPTETASQLLTKIKTVDGASSGLDADLIDGRDSAQFVDLGNTQTITGLKYFDSGLYSERLETGSSTRSGLLTVRTNNGILDIRRLDGTSIGELDLNPAGEFAITTAAPALWIGDDVYLRYSSTATWRDLTAGNINANGYIDFEGSGVVFAQLIADSNGLRVRLGNFRVNENLRVDKDLSVTGVKNFVQPHPEDPTKAIYYVSLEGGEAGTYCRGKGQLVDGRAVIRLPEHFRLVTMAEGLTAQVTPLADCAGIYVVRVTPEELEVRELAGGRSSAPFSFTVNGVRQGYEDFQVIRPSEVSP